MQQQAPEFHLPPGLFPGQTASGGYHYPSHARGSAAALKELTRDLGITQYQLTRLLDAASHTHVSRWFQGMTSPSPIFWSRIVKLMLLRNKGVPVKYIRRINWEDSVIYWRNGDVTREHHLYRSGADSAPPPRLVGPGMTDLPPKSTRPPSTYSEGRPPNEGATFVSA